MTYHLQVQNNKHIYYLYEMFHQENVMKVIFLASSQKKQGSMSVNMDCLVQCQIGAILTFAVVAIVGFLATGLIVKYAKDRPLIQ